MTGKEVAKLVAEYVRDHAERESPLLYPDPQWTVNAYGLLDAICEAGVATEKELGDWTDPKDRKRNPK